MKGFKVTINEEPPIFAGCDRVTSFIIFAGDGSSEGTLSIGGMDASFSHFKWCSRLPKVGDRIKVQVCELDHVSPVSEKRLPDYDELRQEYEKLKKELIEEGKL